MGGYIIQKWYEFTIGDWKCRSLWSSLTISDRKCRSLWSSSRLVIENVDRYGRVHDWWLKMSIAMVEFNDWWLKILIAMVEFTIGDWKCRSLWSRMAKQLVIENDDLYGPKTDRILRLTIALVEKTIGDWNWWSKDWWSRKSTARNGNYRLGTERSNKGGIIHFLLYDVVYQVFAFLIQDGAWWSQSRYWGFSWLYEAMLWWCL